jgi:nucleoid-associated protein YgaU
MTRETKISLLVGLAFVIVIGILLSDRFRAEPAQAPLSSAASMVRAAMDSPGTANPPITVVTPKDAPPTQQVPTRDELNPVTSPVIPSAVAPAQQMASGADASPQYPSQTQPVQNQVAGADSPTDQSRQYSSNDSLSDAARQHGEELVPSNTDGTPAQEPSAVTPGAARTYVAQSGDTVSRMAARLLGEDTEANRQAIIDANPSLQDDPDRVMAGAKYQIPGRAETDSTSIARAPSDSPTAPAAPTDQSSPDNSDTQYIYVVQPDDSLWRIANDELGDPGAVSAIKELNADVLKGGDTVRPGMRLRLPSKPVASAS